MSYYLNFEKKNNHIKRCLLLSGLAFFLFSCSLQMIPVHEQHRSRSVSAPVDVTFSAVKSALMKNGYKIIKMDFNMGWMEAKKIRKSKYLLVSIMSEKNGGSVVKINLTVRKNGKRISVSEKTMAELDAILEDI